MFPTDSLKTLSHRYNMSVADVRAIAKDLDLQMTWYSEPQVRGRWIIAEPRPTVRMFNDHLADLTA